MGNRTIAPTHVVTGAIGLLHQEIADDAIVLLMRKAFQSGRQDLTTWLNDLNVQAINSRDQGYGVAFAVAHKSDSPLNIPQPTLRPGPGFTRRP
jgi:hypothetical protein